MVTIYFFITNIPITDSIDQERLVNTTVAIWDLASICVHHPSQPLTQLIGERLRASMGSKWQSCCTARPTCRKGTSTPFCNCGTILAIDYLSRVIGSFLRRLMKYQLGTLPGTASWSGIIPDLMVPITVSLKQSGCWTPMRFSTMTPS